MRNKFITPIALQSIKETNYNSVLYTIEEKQRISRTEISNITALSPTTVTNICDELIKRGLISEIGTGFSCGGRKPVFLEINSKAGNIISIEIKKELIRAVISDLRCNIESSIFLPVTGSINITDEITALIKKLIGFADLKNVLGIGISLDWLYDYSLRHSVPVHNLAEENLIHTLSQEFSLPVFIDKTQNLTLLSERTFHYANKYTDMIYLHFGDSIDAGILCNNTILRGNSGLAGELAHTTVDLSGQKCLCGKNGCYHTCCSIPSLVQKAIQGAVMGQSEALNSLSHNNLNNINEHVILEAATSGDPFSLNLISEFADNIAVLLHNLVQLFDPKVIILGGKISGFRDIMADMLLTKVKSLNRELSKDIVLDFSHFDKNLAIKGACKLALLNSLSKFTAEESI